MSAALEVRRDYEAVEVRAAATRENLERRERDSDLLAASLRDTVARLHALGMLVAPPPASGLDVARCLERQAQARPTVCPASGCDIARADYRRHRREILAFLDAARAQGVPILSFDEVLCTERRCRTRWDGVVLYRDKDHLSAAGSIELAGAMNWPRLVEDLAR